MTPVVSGEFRPAAGKLPEIVEACWEGTGTLPSHYPEVGWHSAVGGTAQPSHSRSVVTVFTSPFTRTFTCLGSGEARR